MPKVMSGLENLLKNHRRLLHGRRIGLVTNPTGVTAQLRSSIDAIAHLSPTSLPSPSFQLRALFAPEHGMRGETQDGLTIASSVDEVTGLPVHSLYGAHRKPTKQMLGDIDLLIYDIQDVGCRYYTYLYTLSYVMEAATEHDVEVMVLDRPNPITGRFVEGPLLDPSLSSFIGRYPIPVRHGLTLGELAQYINREFGIGCRLKIIPMQAWRRRYWFDQTGLPWIAPSPNMPTPDTATVYPGTCLFEGTNVSEGRGTTHPFEWIGAPYVKAHELVAHLNALELKGVLFRPVSFMPTYSKHTNVLCHGAQVHVTNRNILQAFEVGLRMIAAFIQLYPTEFEFLPTSWEGHPPHFDLLTGMPMLREALLTHTPVVELTQTWQQPLRDFRQRSALYQLYE
jgi:uncharacterized protein YbbC (DUF1343 family)